MNYNEITSEYIKMMFHKTSWQDHEKIDDLIKLHGYIVNPPISFNSGWHFTQLKSKYPSEYLDLLGEFSPVALENELAHQRSFDEMQSENLAKSISELEHSKESWLSSGGKP